MSTSGLKRTEHASNFTNINLACFTFTDTSVEVECAVFLLTPGFSASDARAADMHNKLHKILK